MKMRMKKIFKLNRKIKQIKNNSDFTYILIIKMISRADYKEAWK